MKYPYTLRVSMKTYHYPTTPDFVAALVTDGRNFTATEKSDRKAVRAVKRKARKWAKYGPKLDQGEV